VLVHDGATGTELEARGVDSSSGAWSAAANLEAPDVLRAIHEDYLSAGADIITANNYCTGPSFLDRTGEGARWRDYSQAGLDVALAARDAINRDAYVAGGMYPNGVLGREFTNRARLLADGGADLILVEFLPSANECVGAAEACAEIDLPLFLGVGNLNEDGNLADETSIETLVSALQGHRIDGILFMCTFPPAISRALPRLRASFSGFIGAYPHAGLPSNPEYTPGVLAEHAGAWKEMGAQVIGGCCGTGPPHIAAVASALK
jgi:S-methylmethionine-dependent homocysteine/selenocysteine methylase